MTSERLLNRFEDLVLEHKSKSINILYVNACSIRNKFDELKICVDQLKHPEIICVTETWLYTPQESEFKLNDYNAIFVSRDDGRGGGIG